MLHSINDPLKKECDELVKKWLFRNDGPEQLAWDIYNFVRKENLQAILRNKKDGKNKYVQI